MADRDDTTAPKWREVLHLHGLRSLQFKASLLVVLLILMVSIAGTALSVNSARTALLQNELHRTHQWAASLANSEAVQVENRNREVLQTAANSLIRTHGVAYVAFADRHGQILASAESCAGLLHSANGAPGNEDDGRILPQVLDRPQFGHHKTTEVAYIDVVVPISVHAPGEHVPTAPGRLVGFLRFGTDITDAQAKLHRMATGLVRTAAGVLLLVVPCSLVVTRRVVAPLRQLARAARALAQGTLDVRAPVTAQDEIGELARSFNFMADEVARTQRELLELNAELERRVVQRTRDLEEQAARDPLTGLYNRRHFGEVIAREFATAERYDCDLTCLMFDVDHFKTVNDRYGHRTGDRVLLALAHAISAELRSSDVAARFGGDEFIVLLPQTAATQASGLADRIVARFAQSVAELAPGVDATLSIGVASLCTTRARSSEALIHEADVALYAAKRAGRNRTMEAAGAA